MNTSKKNKKKMKQHILNLEGNSTTYYVKCKGTRQHNILTKKGKDVTNPRDIANAFNNLSIDIGPTLSKTIPSSQNKNLHVFSKIVH